MTSPTRWYLQKSSHGDVMLVVERVSDRRGYRCFVVSRQHARGELKHLKRLTDSIDRHERLARTYDAEVGGIWLDEFATVTAEQMAQINDAKPR